MPAKDNVTVSFSSLTANCVPVSIRKKTIAAGVFEEVGHSIVVKYKAILFIYLFC